MPTKVAGYDKVLNSKRWAKFRVLALERDNYMCTNCKFERATIVHHVVHIDASNINNANLVFNLDNVTSLCTKCHNRVHYSQTVPDFTFNEDGDIAPLLSG